MAHLRIFPLTFVDRDYRMDPLPTDLQNYVKQIFWPDSKASIAEYASYFKYFQKAISDLAWPDGITYNQHFAMKTYGDLETFTKYIKENTNLNRAVLITDKLKHEFPDSSIEQISRSIDLTAHLWLNLNVRSIDYNLGPKSSQMTNIEWTREASLSTVIQKSFPEVVDERLQPIDAAFTVENLRRFCRIEVDWTPNLKDHLSYDPKKSKLLLFPHKICLISHLECENVLPKDFVSETIKTLDLLFPFADGGARKFLDDKQQPFYRTSSRDHSRPTDLTEFRYWRKRLDILQQVFHQAPRNMGQLWYDRRNPLQWWTFWLAALIAFLTIVFGIISSYTSFRQVTLAEKAYLLSVLQACSQDNSFPEICGK